MADIPPSGAGGLAPGGGGAAGQAKDQAKDQADAGMGKVTGDAGNKAQTGKDTVDASKPGQPGTGNGGGHDSSGPAGGEPAKLALDSLKGGPAAAATGKLGAGGTSLAGDKGDEAESGEGAGGPGGKGNLGKNAALAAAVPAAGVGAQLMVLMMFLNWLKGILLAIAALLANLWGLIWGAIVAAAKAVVGFFMSIGAGIAGAVGGAISTVAGGIVAGITSFALVVMGGGAVVSASNAGSDLAQRDGTVEDCTVAADETLSNIDDPDVLEDVTTKKNAETVYSVFSAWGMPDENIAGILGNWDAESRIDPTAMQGIFDEPHTMGPKKRAADDGSFTAGIGLGQWTGGRNENLRRYAEESDAKWHGLQIQMGFMISAAEGADAKIVKDMIEESKGTPAEAAVFFHDEWERSADTSMSLRESNATKWMGLAGGWTADTELADSILNQSGATVDDADQAEAASVRSTCRQADGGNVQMSEGGLTQQEAQEIIDLYLKEGDSFLDQRYGAGGGPGSCGSDHAMNCVSFSTYFLNKYTSFQQYPKGNGIDTASAVAAMADKETSKVPTPYSVGSGPGSGPAGHTFVVLGVEGENLVIAEAGYCSNRGSVRVAPISEFGAWEFVDVSDLLLPEDEIKTS